MRADAWLMRGGMLLCAALWLATAAQFCTLIVLVVAASIYDAPARAELASLCAIGAALTAFLALWLRCELRRARRRLRRALRRAAPPRPSVRDAIAAVPHVAPELPAPPPFSARSRRTG